MTYRVIHRTTYEYREPVTVSHHAARMRPRSTATQAREDFVLQIEPTPALRKMRSDFFGNRVCYFSVQEIHRRLEVTATSVVAVTASTPPALGLSPAWAEVAGMFRDPVPAEAVDPYQFCFDSPLLRSNPELAAWARECFDGETPLLVGVARLNARIHREFRYDPVATSVATPLEEVWEQRAGVCQDFAHLAIASLRSLGLAARYVSGYLRTHAPPGRERLVGADASHAWFSVFCPRMGWVDFDPTNDLLPADEHITVAYGRDFSDVSPFTGIITGGGLHEVKVSVDVEPLGPGTPAGE